MNDLDIKVRGAVYNPRSGKYEKGKHGPARKVELSRNELLALRERMSVNVMAEYLGVSRGTVYKYLRTANLIGNGDDKNAQEERTANRSCGTQ